MGSSAAVLQSLRNTSGPIFALYLIRKMPKSQATNVLSKIPKTTKRMNFTSKKIVEGCAIVSPLRVLSQCDIKNEDVCFLCKIAVDDIFSFEQIPDQYNQEYQQCTAKARFEILNQDSTRYYCSIIIAYIQQELLSLVSNFYLPLNYRCMETCVNSAHQQGYLQFFPDMQFE